MKTPKRMAESKRGYILMQPSHYRYRTQAHTPFVDPKDEVVVFAVGRQDLYLPDVNKTQDQTPLWSPGCSRASRRCTATCRAQSREGCTGRRYNNYTISF